MGFTKAALASSLLLLGQAAAIDPIVMKVSLYPRTKPIESTGVVEDGF